MVDPNPINTLSCISWLPSSKVEEAENAKFDNGTMVYMSVIPPMLSGDCTAMIYTSHCDMLNQQIVKSNSLQLIMCMLPGI